MLHHLVITPTVPSRYEKRMRVEQSRVTKDATMMLGSMQSRGAHIADGCYRYMFFVSDPEFCLAPVNTSVDLQPVFCFVRHRALHWGLESWAPGHQIMCSKTHHLILLERKLIILILMACPQPQQDSTLSGRLVRELEPALSKRADENMRAHQELSGDPNQEYFSQSSSLTSSPMGSEVPAGVVLEVVQKRSARKLVRICDLV